MNISGHPSIRIVALVALAFFSWPVAAPAQTTKSGKVIFLTLDADMNEVMLQRYRAHQVQYWYDAKLFTYLDEHHIPTTFFASGLFAEAYPNLVRSLSQNPLFSIQNHSYDEAAFVPHCYWLRSLSSRAEKITQIVKTQRIVQDLTGKTPALFRYPGLCRDGANDAIVESLGLKINDGDIIASDPFNNDTDKIVHNVLKQAKGGGVIIMHVGGPNAPKSLNALKKIIPALRSKGYLFGRLL